ncbi:hypothetical protein BDV38DRAFT_282749 [Aspergillus pseudotamarii]|uniref:NmrA-like domain-containing protein n=1 Tax=Aspergillus pseudotamarii TaxID=132259 RepID=A0A5N6SVQ2_ASPPS|nr:uncharacterized protein BDV38DRAFT_282749 [Aspergillus pseudotamarii]KAE8137820.1 hypothetical protein BDV38DRAFT_282749 [Aspergillus pseudotamarii]
MSKDTIVIFGATGKQGGSVVDSILNDPTAASRFHVKAVTRDISTDKAKALAAKGAELVTGDLNDKESLRPVIKGAYGVFAVTNFWEIFSAEKEVQQGKNTAEVCKEEGVQHLVWSSLLNINKLTNGVLSQVYHFDGKAEVEEYIRSLDIPATFFLAGFFMSNVPGVSFRQIPTGSYALSMPVPDDAPVPLFAAEFDTGKFVKAIFLKRDATLGKRIYGATSYSTPAEMVATFQKVYPEAGKDAKFNQLSHEAFKGIMAATGAPEIIQEEMLQNMRLLSEFGYYGGDALEPSLAIVDEPLTTWEEYIKQAAAFASLK